MADTPTTPPTIPARTPAHTGRGAGSNPLVTGRVSLANLLTSFMGEPLAASGLYDDVQLIFYPFNSYAGFASRINIANFIIDLDFFSEKYTEYRLTNLSRSGNLTIRQFWTFLINNIIDDPAATSYGLSDGPNGNNAIYHRIRERGENRQETTVTRAVDSDEATRINRLNNLLATVTPDGSFKMPNLNFSLECMPGRASTEASTSEIANEKTILRIHIYDQVASSYDGLGSILRSQRNQALTVGTNPNRAGAGLNSLVSEVSTRYYQQMFQRANQLGLVERTENGIYEVVGGSNAIKQFMYQTTPYIIHGAKNSLVKQANLSSMPDPAANTLSMLRTPRGGSNIQPNGEDIGGLPMQILPTELTMETFGCPLLHFTSQYFIDFNTGTTADNLYCINGIEHRISSGEFTTNIKFIAMDGYGQYRNYIQEINDAIQATKDILARISEQNPVPTPAPARTGGYRRRLRMAEHDFRQREEAAERMARAETLTSRRLLGRGDLANLPLAAWPEALRIFFMQNLHQARETLRVGEAQARLTAAQTERQLVEGRRGVERQASDIQRQASGPVIRPPVSQEPTDQQIEQLATAQAQTVEMQMPSPPSPAGAATGRTIDPRLAQSIAGSATPSAAGAPRAAGTPRNRTT
jgi:hypothetical protein